MVIFLKVCSRFSVVSGAGDGEFAEDFEEYLSGLKKGRASLD
jgi:hypothetical protein